MANQQESDWEARLGRLEVELCRSKERLRLLEECRRRVIRACFVVTGGAAALLVLIGQTVPALGNGPSTVTAPFTVMSSSGKPLFKVFDNGVGAQVSLQKDNGTSMMELGPIRSGEGATITVYSANRKLWSNFYASDSRGPGIGLYREGVLLATLAMSADGPFFQLNNQKGPAVLLLVSKETGKLELTDKDLNLRVLAGTEINGDGTVKVSGPTQRCYPGFVGLPCMLVAH
jgi:hypothetical protein